MESLTLTHSILNGLKLLSFEDAGKAVSLLSNYVQDGVEAVSDDPRIQMFLSMAVAEIETLRFYRESGKKGGRPKKEDKPRLKENNWGKTGVNAGKTGFFQTNGKIKTQKEYGAFCLSDLNSEQKTGDKRRLKTDNGGLTGVNDKKSEKEKAPYNPKKENIYISPKRTTNVVQKSPFSLFDDISVWWNVELASKFGVAEIKKTTVQREAALARRVSEAGTLDDFKRIVMTAFEKSSFLRGESASGWKADFDFCLQSKSFTKMSEGGYNDSGSGSNDKALTSWNGIEGVPL